MGRMLASTSSCNSVGWLVTTLVSIRLAFPSFHRVDDDEYDIVVETAGSAESPPGEKTPPPSSVVPEEDDSSERRYSTTGLTLPSNDS